MTLNQVRFINRGTFFCYKYYMVLCITILGNFKPHDEWYKLLMRASGFTSGCFPLLTGTFFLSTHLSGTLYIFWSYDIIIVDITHALCGAPFVLEFYDWKNKLQLQTLSVLEEMFLTLMCVKNETFVFPSLFLLRHFTTMI